MPTSYALSMKLFTALALAALSPIVLAQNSPPPPYRGGLGRQTGMGSARSNPSSRSDTATFIETEAIRILRLQAVQVDLALTRAELEDLSTIALTLGKTHATEEIAYTTVSQALTASQVLRFRQLLIQDLGYNALALADVREQLALTEPQIAQVTSLVSTFEAAKLGLTTLDPTTATKENTNLMAKTGTELAKVLTSDQDQKLRSLAGRAMSRS